MKNDLWVKGRASLKRLLDNPDGLYEVTRLKREPKNFSIKEITAELKRGKQIQELYHTAKKLLPELGVSNESVKYYASLVNYYSTFRLHQLNEHMVYIYLICFIFYRYQRLHDNLISCLLFHVKRYHNEAKDTAKEKLSELRVEH